MRTTVVLALALVLSGIYFGYRITRLEQRLDALHVQLGQPEPAAVIATAAKPAGAHEQRLTALEHDVRSLHDDLRTLEKAVNAPPSPAFGPGNEQQILSIVGREQGRIRDRQLQFQRTRWIGWREAAIESFAARYGLSSVQADELRKLLTDEVDQMIEILRRPDAADNPEKSTADWMAMLERTDERARRVLDPAQRGPWDEARAVERHVLWPWLPSQESK